MRARAWASLQQRLGVPAIVTMAAISVAMVASAGTNAHRTLSPRAGVDAISGQVVATHQGRGHAGSQPGPVSGARRIEAAAVGEEEGVLVPDSRGTGCGALAMNSDAGYENAFAWLYGGVQAPYYGAFAECYQGGQEVCSVVLDLTQTGDHVGQSLDAYVWADAGAYPGNVLAAQVGYVPSSIAFWPSVSRHAVDFSLSVSGEIWAGYWGNWPGSYAAFYVAADLDGFGGCPATNVAPGLGIATGWQSPTVIWGPMNALGIGLEWGDIPVPVLGASWGRVKALYGK